MPKTNPISKRFRIDFGTIFEDLGTSKMRFSHGRVACFEDFLRSKMKRYLGTVLGVSGTWFGRVFERCWLDFGALKKIQIFEDEGDTRKSSLGPAGDSSPEGFQEASEKIFGLFGGRAAFLEAFMVSPEGFQKASAKLFCLRGVCCCGLFVLGVFSDVHTAYL